MVALARRALPFRRPAPEAATVVTAGVRPSRRRRTETIVLTAAGLLLGACIASAVFVGMWRHETSRAKAAELALADSEARLGEATATVATLERDLRAGSVERAKVVQELNRRAAQLRGLAAAGRPILSEAAALEEQAAATDAQAAELAASATKLERAVAALSGYLRETPATALDPAFLEAQLAYLRDGAETLRAGSGSLRASAGALAETRNRLDARAAKLAELARRAKQR